MKAVFFGYPLRVKGYKVWLIDEKCVISKDMVFNEFIFYKTNMHGNIQHIRVVLDILRPIEDLK